MSLLQPRVLKSTFNGVEYITATNKYKAYIYDRRGIKITVGLFDDEIEAAKERDIYILKTRKKIGRSLNFPAINYQI